MKFYSEADHFHFHSFIDLSAVQNMNYLIYFHSLRATRPSRNDAEQNGGRRGERFCYSFCRRKQLQRDFCESCVSETEIKKESPFLSCIELTVQQGDPYYTEYSLRIIYNLQFEESNFWFDVYFFQSL